MVVITLDDNGCIASRTRARKKIKVDEVKEEAMVEHTKCRGTHYGTGASAVKKFEVVDEFAKWERDFPGYKPVEFTISLILDKQPFWADPNVTDVAEYGKIKFNQLDGKTNRKSFHKDD